MADVTLPQLGETVTEGTITQWFKAVGDTVEIDEPLFEVSTDKVDSEVPSPASGVLTEIRVPEGETVDVGTVLAVVGDAGDAPAAPTEESSADTSEPEPAPTPPPAATPAPAPEPTPPVRAQAPAEAPAAAPATGAPGSVTSPIVRSILADGGVEVSQVTGSGPGGRVTRADAEAAAAAAASGRDRAPAPQSPAPQAPSPAPATAQPTAPRTAPAGAPVADGARDRVEPFNTMRRITGEHMVYSKSVAPHVLMTAEVDYEGVEVVRRRHGADFEATEGFPLSYLPFITMAVVDAIREHPRVNASVGDGELVIHDDINLGIAVDLHHEGLIVPVVHGADGLRLRAVAREIRAVADRARSSTLTADDVTGGTFTISNPGPYGTHFTGAIISQPEVAILSTDGISRKPVVITGPDGTEAVGIHSVGLLALSFDHRAFDGAYAASFLAAVKVNIETRDWEVELS